MQVELLFMVVLIIFRRPYLFEVDVLRGESPLEAVPTLGLLFGLLRFTSLQIGDLLVDLSHCGMLSSLLE